MNDQIRLGGLLLFFTVFFTFMYSQFPADEYSNWLKELVWWGMALGWISTFILAGLLAYKYWRKLLGMIGDIQTERQQAQNEEVKRRLEQFDALIQRLGEAEAVSQEALQSTVLQAQGIANVIVELHKRSIDLARKVNVYDRAFNALVEGNPLQIARAAGGIDSDLRILMTTSEADEAFYHQIARSVAERQSDTQEWLIQYQILRNDLVGMLTGIMVRLTQVRAHGEAAHAAQPLMLAEKNLTKAYDTLKLGIDDKPTLQIAGLNYRHLRNGTDPALQIRGR